MKRDHFYTFLFFTLPVLYFLSLPVCTGDLAVWIAHGKYLLQHKTILRHDPFSVLPTKELVYPVGVTFLYGILNSLGGLFTVAYFHKIAVTLTVSWLWYRYAVKRFMNKWSYRNMAMILLTWFGCSMFWIERPAYLAVLFLIPAFLILDKEGRLSGKDFLKLHLLAVVWVNFHGSWPLLFLMYVWRVGGRIFSGKERFQWQQLVACLSLLLSYLLNPMGIKVFPYIFETAQASKMRVIDEWMAPSLSGPYQTQALAFFLLVSLFIALLYFHFRHSKHHTMRILASPFTLLIILGFSNIRNTALPFFVLPFFVSHFCFDCERTKPSQDKKNNLNLAFAALVLAACFAMTPSLKKYADPFLPEKKRGLFDRSTPVEAALFLNSTKDNDPVFNDWDYGSYLILQQRHKIFIDTRNIIYDEYGFMDYVRVVQGFDGWEFVLNKYGIRYVLLNKREHSKMTGMISHHHSWKTVLETENFILLERIPESETRRKAPSSTR